MPDVIDVFVEVNEFGDVLLDEAEVLVAAEVRNVIDVAGDEVIEADDFVSFGEEVIGEVRTEKACCAGDDGEGLGFLLLFGAARHTRAEWIPEGGYGRK